MHRPRHTPRRPPSAAAHALVISEKADPLDMAEFRGMVSFVSLSEVHGGCSLLRGRASVLAACVCSSPFSICVCPGLAGAARVRAADAFLGC